MFGVLRKAMGCFPTCPLSCFRVSMTRSGILCLSPRGCWPFGVTDPLLGGPNECPVHKHVALVGDYRSASPIQLVEVRELPNVSAQETVGSSQKMPENRAKKVLDQPPGRPSYHRK